MATNVIMPALGIAQETGKLLQWMKAEGEAVKKGDVLMVVETDKTTVEIEADASGILSNVTVGVGQEAPVGQVIALILAPGEARPPNPPPAGRGEIPATLEGPMFSTPVTAASPLARRIAEENNVDISLVKPSGERIEKADVLAYLENLKPGLVARLAPASPKARVAAGEHGIDLTTIQGSGLEGAVIYADVMAAKASKGGAISITTARRPNLTSSGRGETASMQEESAVSEETVKTGTIWRIMAERTTQSWTSVPHFYLTREVHAGRLMTWRERAQKRSPVKITYTDLIVRLTAAALIDHPRVNASWQDGAVHVNREVNIGLAVAIEDGLVVPVIKRASELSVGEIASRRAEVVGRAQAGKLKPDDIAGGTFTISNLGMYGIDSFNAIVNAPQAAILAVGRIVPRVTPVDDRPAVQNMMTLTLSCDHRAVDGARGAQFLQALAEMIEEPLGLLD